MNIEALENNIQFKDIYTFIKNWSCAKPINEYFDWFSINKNLIKDLFNQFDIETKEFKIKILNISTNDLQLLRINKLTNETMKDSQSIFYFFAIYLLTAQGTLILK